MNTKISKTNEPQKLGYLYQINLMFKSQIKILH